MPSPLQTAAVFRNPPWRGAALCLALALGTCGVRAVVPRPAPPTAFETEPWVDRWKEARALDPAVDLVVERIIARLDLMHDVARWKWHARRPIDDPERERALADALVARWSQRGLDEAFLRRFVQNQFDAAKQIQRADFATWSAQTDPRVEESPDLAQIQRPRIEAATDALLEAVVAYQSLRRRSNREHRARLDARLDQAVLREILKEFPGDPSDIPFATATAALLESIRPSDRGNSGGH